MSKIITTLTSLGIVILLAIMMQPIYKALAAEIIVDRDFDQSTTYENFGLCEPGDTATFRNVGHETIWDNGHTIFKSDIFLTVVSTDGSNIGGGHSTFGSSVDFTGSGANGFTFTGNVIEHCVEQGIIHHEHAGYTFTILPDGRTFINYHGPQQIG
jgi:hypothetical protein